MSQQVSSPVSAPSFCLKFKQEFYDAVPHLMRGTVTTLEAKDPNVGIGLDIHKRSQPTKEDEVVAEGATQSLHCFYKEGKTRYFIATSDPDFQALKDKLLRECQLQHILCDENGYVMDGFARWVALEMVNIEPKYTIVGNLPDDDAKITFIRSQKLCRHNLTEEERMKIVKDEIVAHPKRAIAWTASLLGVSRTTVHKYRKELEGLGQVPVLRELETRDGRLVEHESYSKEQKAKDDAKDEAAKKGRVQAAAATREANFKEAAERLFKDQLVKEEAPRQSLQNIAKFANALHHLTETDKKAAAVVVEKLAEKAGIRLSVAAPLPVSVKAEATWDVKTVDLKKTKQGVTIKVDADAMPDKVDVALGVVPGQVSVNGKVINFQAGKALFLMPQTPKDAVIEPPSEDDLMTGTAGPHIDPDELLNASDN
jgi:hypothetical protein